MQINQAKFTAIVEAAKAKAANDPKWLRAIERAAKEIISGEMIVTTLAHGALITTARGTYAANGHCNCEAARRGHKECKHRAAARLMDLYETAPEVVSLADDVAASSRENLIIEIENIWSRVEPTVHLQDALLCRFGTNQIHTLATETLIDIRLAIAR
jgi:hypothetical protein